VTGEEHLLDRRLAVQGQVIAAPGPPHPAMTFGYIAARTMAAAEQRCG
jgi:hypothetical protein